MEWSLEEIKRKDKVFGSWQDLDSEYLKKLKGGELWSP